MALFSRSKRKTIEAAPPAPAERTPEPSAGPRETPKSRPLDKARGERRFIGVILAPHLTEKTSGASGQRWYTFRIAPQATKLTVRRAVEERYGVSVEKMRIIRSRPKQIRLGRILGATPGFKKAMVKLAAGQSIEFT